MRDKAVSDSDMRAVVWQYQVLTLSGGANVGTKKS
jgi:hypothetical protein